MELNGIHIKFLLPAISHTSHISPQWKEFGLWRSGGVLRSEAPVQADPAPWPWSLGFLLPLSAPKYPTLHFSRCLLSLPTWWPWRHQAEDRGSEGTFHENRPAAFPVCYFRASIGWGERVATGHQQECFWYGHWGGDAHSQHQVVTTIEAQFQRQAVMWSSGGDGWFMSE